jgi:hypothetical protein
VGFECARPTDLVAERMAGRSARKQANPAYSPERSKRLEAPGDEPCALAEFGCVGPASCIARTRIQSGTTPLIGSGVPIDAPVGVTLLTSPVPDAAGELAGL